jgi:chemotaxis signal transduction protein
MTEPGLLGGFVTFRLGDREFAARLGGIREVLRLENLLALPGMVSPMAGVIEVRGVPLPVMDVRPVAGAPGDVLVLTHGPSGDGADTTNDSSAIGIAVDGVTAVRGPGELRHDADGEVPFGLPAYVIEVLRETTTSKPVLLVDLRRMLELVAV